MTFDEIDKYLADIPDEILTEASHIIAETATEYYKATFSQKAFELLSIDQRYNSEPTVITEGNKANHNIDHSSKSIETSLSLLRVS